LYDAGSIAQIDENHAPVIATAINPAAKRDGLADVFAT
jgi:hypothetical protein